MTVPDDRQGALRQAILDIARMRGTRKSLCPSEAARAVAGQNGDWRGLMNDTRAVAADLAHEGHIEITQKNMIVDSADARGPIRLRLVR